MKTLMIIILVGVLATGTFDSQAQYRRPINPKVQRDIGMALTVNGVLITGIGTAVLCNWMHNIIQEDATGHIDMMNEKEFHVGAGLTLVGVGMSIVGVPMWINGRTQLRITGSEVGVKININKRKNKKS